MLGRSAQSDRSVDAGALERGAQIADAERLGEVRHARPEQLLDAVALTGMAADEDRAQRRPAGAQLLEERRPVRSGHDDVAHDDVGHEASFLDAPPYILRISSLDDGVALALERRSDHAADGVVVLDEQDAHGRRRRRRQGRSADRRRLRDGGQEHLEARAVRLDVAHPHEAAVLAHDAVDAAEPEPDSATFFATEERLEDALEDTVVDAGAAVGDREAYVVARLGPLDVANPGRAGRLDEGGRDLDHEAAAARHRVARVGAQVDEDLIDAAAVGPDEAGLGRAVEGDRHVLANYGAQQRQHPQHHVAQIDRLHLDALVARERQELARELGGALGGGADVVEVAARRIAGLGRGEREIEPRHHDQQEVVEVVRDAAGEQAHRLETLRLLELRLELHAIGHVATDGLQL